jgi:hypothetical protein
LAAAVTYSPQDPNTLNLSERTRLLWPTILSFDIPSRRRLCKHYEWESNIFKIPKGI